MPLLRHIREESDHRIGYLRSYRGSLWTPCELYLNLNHHLEHAEQHFAMANGFDLPGFRHWLQSDEVKPFWDEFEEDYLRGATGGLPRPSEQVHRKVLYDFVDQAADSFRGRHHRLRPCKDEWGAYEHWAWFSFNVWWTARQNYLRTGRARWRPARVESRHSPIMQPKKLWWLLHFLQIQWIQTSAVALENRRSALRSGRSIRPAPCTSGLGCDHGYDEANLGL